MQAASRSLALVDERRIGAPADHGLKPGSMAADLDEGSENEPFAPLMQIISRPSSPPCGGELPLRIGGIPSASGTQRRNARASLRRTSRLDAARFEMFLS
jgi:hypothetical protein